MTYLERFKNRNTGTTRRESCHRTWSLLLVVLTFFALGCSKDAPPHSERLTTGACESSPCQNGGVCHEREGGFSCACTAPFFGDTCEESQGSCSDGLCENDANCIDLDDTFLCECAAGFSGTLCDSSAGCTPNPCENGGVCVGVGSSYECECSSGFSGPTCAEPGEDEENCIDSDDTFPCECVEDSSGTLCDSSANCTPNPCENGGVCVGVGASYECACAIGFAGANCAEARAPGLAARPENTTCIAPERPVFAGPLEWQHDRDGRADFMMMTRQLPDDSWIEIYRDGQVYFVSAELQRQSAPLLTLPDVVSTDELGLLGLAVHPNYPASPYFYFYYAALESDSVYVRIDRYTATGSGASLAIDAGSRLEIFEFDRGQAYGIHAGGAIEFDPTATVPTLYAAMGDGGQDDLVQDGSTYFGKLVRIFVDTAPYTPQVIGTGLRNPFRFSFDSLTGDLWIGDVGGSLWEEINFIAASDIPTSDELALNFGWPILEGNACRSGSDPSNYCGQSAPTVLPLIAPIHTYAHTENGGFGVSVIGGRVYRGDEIAGLSGTYIFGDIWANGGERSWRLLPNPDSSDPNDSFVRSVIPGNHEFIAFTEDNAGALYGITRLNGDVVRLVASSGDGGTGDTLPSALSETGCFDQDGMPASALVPYDLNAPLWSDGSSKLRWIALPNEASATIEDDGDLEFPNGTILAKEFSMDGVRVETRLFIRHPDGVWAGYSYAWIDEEGNAESDGRLLPDEVITRNVPGTNKTWTYPSRGQCTQCHTSAAGGSLGLEIGQLNRDFNYSSGVTANQVHTLSSINMITGSLDSFTGRAIPAYDDESAPLADRAWAYLHANCSSCHQPGASGMQGRSSMPDLRYDLFANRSDAHPLQTVFCDVPAGAGDLGLGPGALLVTPGNPGNWAELEEGGSILFLRMAARPAVDGTSGAMPQIGSAVVDDEWGLPLVQEWIENLSCP